MMSFHSIFHAARRRISISSYEELTERKMIATAQRKHDNCVHLNSYLTSSDTRALHAELRNNVDSKPAPCKSYPAVTHVHVLNSN